MFVGVEAVLGVVVASPLVAAARSSCGGDLVGSRWSGPLSRLEARSGAYPARSISSPQARPVVANGRRG